MLRALGVAAILSGALSLDAETPVPSPLAVAIGPTSRLLVLSPQPDDKTLGAAGLMRRVVATDLPPWQYRKRRSPRQ